MNERRRGDVRAHEEPRSGHVTDLFPDHGFIRDGFRDEQGPQVIYMTAMGPGRPTA